MAWVKWLLLVLVLSEWAQSESPTRLRPPPPPPDNGRCHIKEIMGCPGFRPLQPCPLQPIFTPINVNQSSSAMVVIEFLQLYKRGNISWMAMDCVDPSETYGQEGDPSGTNLTNPTCSDCCHAQENVPLGPIPSSQRTCLCMQGFATVTMYVHDRQVPEGYGPLIPPIPDRCTPPADAANTCRFVYQIPCGCVEELYDMGEYPNLNLLKPETVVTILQDGSKRIQQTLDLDFAPNDPEAGPPVHTHLVTNITVDPKNHSFVDLSDFVDAELVACFQTYIVIDVNKSHQLADVLSPAANAPLTVIVTAPATWLCDGNLIFRKVLFADWDEEESFLLVNTTAIAFEDVIRDGEIRLETNNLMVDLDEQTPADDEGGVQSAMMFGLQVQHEHPAARKLTGLGGWLKKQAKKVLNTLTSAAKALKKLVSGSVNAEKRKKLLDQSVERSQRLTAGPVVLGISAKASVSLTLNVGIEIKRFRLQKVHLYLEGAVEKRCEVSVASTAEHAWKKEWVLMYVPFQPIIIMIGPIPIVITPGFALKGGFDMKVGFLKASAWVQASASAKYGFTYSRDSGFQAINEYVPRFEHGRSLTTEATFSAFVYVQPELAVDISLVKPKQSIARVIANSRFTARIHSIMNMISFAVQQDLLVDLRTRMALCECNGWVCIMFGKKKLNKMVHAAYGAGDRLHVVLRTGRQYWGSVLV